MDEDLKAGLKARIDQLPRSPGVYIMRGQSGEIIYIGKATDLRSRVRSYFSGSDQRAFVPWLETLLFDVDTIVTASPKEALLLENTLIKKHKPRFNVRLRDDSNYLSLRIDLKHEWPRVEVVRRRLDDGALYFGPYASAAKVRETLSILNRFFQLRTCRDSVLYNRSRPCLQYQIHRCPAPCVGHIDREAYMDNVEQAVLFLRGRATDLQTNLEAKMLAAAEDLRFEEAARLRDQLRAIEASMTKQLAVLSTDALIDVIGFSRRGSSAMVVIIEFREGALSTVHRFPLNDQMVDDGTLLAQVINQFYISQQRIPPPVLLSPTPPIEVEALEELLSERAERKVQVITPQRGQRREMLSLAKENAKTSLADHLDEERIRLKSLERLQRRLHLPRLPQHIECFDISNFQGDNIVASQVVFINALPDRSRYRRIRIRSVASQDDYESLREALTRRAKRAAKGDEPMPDLLIIDGGKGQLHAVRQALLPKFEAQLTNTTIIGLAESRLEGTQKRTREDDLKYSPERVFLHDAKEPIALRAHSDERHLLERIRNEAHNTALRYHRSLRKRTTITSRLDQIPGIGPKRRQALLKHFGNIKAIEAADLASLEATPGLPSLVAWSVFDFFHPGEADPPASEVETAQSSDELFEELTPNDAEDGGAE